MSAAAPVITYDAAGKPFAVFCGVCHAGAWRVASFGGGLGAVDAAVVAARACCGERRCSTCNEPIAPHAFCRPCESRAATARMERAFETATKVPVAEYAGRMVSDGDEAFVDPADWADVADPLVAADGTRFLWGTSSEVPRVDFERELEDWLQEHHEDACEWVDFQKLKAAQDLANEALSAVRTFYVDESVAVILPAADVDDEDEERDPINGQLVSAKVGGSVA